MCAHALLYFVILSFFSNYWSFQCSFEVKCLLYVIYCRKETSMAQTVSLTHVITIMNLLPFSPYDCAKRKKFSHLHPGAHGHRRLPGPHPPHPSNLCLLPTPLTYILLLGATLAQSGGSSSLPQPWRSRWRGCRGRRRRWRKQRPVVTAVTWGWGRRGIPVSHEQHGHLHRDRQLWQRR